MPVATRTRPGLRSLAPAVLATLILVTVVGGALRVQAASSPSTYQSVDERAYAKIARGLATRLHYGNPQMDDPVHWPPGAPALFAIAFAMDPRVRGDGVHDVPAAYPLQAAVATAVIPLTFVLAMLVAGPAAGLAAATAAALYPPLARSPSDLLSEPLGNVLLLAALISVALALRRRSAPRFCVAGVLLGATVLTRADLLLVPALAAGVVAVAVRRRAGAWRPALAPVAALAAGCLLLVGPWSWFASRQAGAPVLVSSGGASNLFVGTFLPGDGTMFGAKRALAGEVRGRYPRFEDTPPSNILQQFVIRTVAARRPELGTQAALRAEGLANLRRYALGEPVAFARMMGRKVRRLWLGYTVGTHRNTRPWITAVHLLLVALSAAGLAGGLWRRRDVMLVLICAILLYVTALNAVFVSEARHNLAVMPILLVAGAAGWAMLLGSERAS